MKKLVGKIVAAWKKAFPAKERGRQYALSEAFCSNCATGLPVIFPVYMAGTDTNKGKFFKVVNRNNIQVVTMKSGVIAISNHYDAGETLIFQQIIDGTIYNHGFKAMTELEYHLEFNLASKDTTLLHTSNLHNAR